MLDDVTKKKINTLRQILVGKLPDPKAQVEQITNGLIYKFMNDMDDESVSMGGKATYFSGKFKKYSWKQLMDTKTSGVEKVSLYSEAIEQMYNNENLPELFREIFKNSFLPFKDASTLNMFLKEINSFNYSHSEKLGDAFEYLLSFMGSQGDAGQFRTPRHIIDFIVEIVNPQKNETILDPACGTAGFLISSYKHILNQNTKKNLGDGLNSSDRKKIGENLNGYDISPDMVKMSLVNMYLHKFTNPKINEYDTLSSEDRWNEYYDVILANPPFFSPKGGITPHNRFGVKSTKAEVLFIDYINEHLKPNGRAGIIVPEGIIFQGGIAYKQLRKKLIQTSLIGVISLPAGIFQPYSGVKTSILILDKQQNKKLDRIVFIKVENDGYSLSAQRKAIKGSQLKDISENFKKYLFEDKIEKYSNIVLKDKILKNNDFSLSISNYTEEKTSNNLSLNFYKMKDIINVDWGNTSLTKSSYKEDGKYLGVSAAGIDGKIDKYEYEGKKIVISAIGARCGKVFFPNDKFTAIKNTIVLHKPKKDISEKFLFYVLDNNIDFFPKRGGGQPFISKGDIEKTTLYLPNLETQNQIVKELDCYQKIIEGCEQVIENFTPSIDIDQNWEMIELNQVADFKRGPFGGSLKKEIFKSEGYLVYEQYHAINDDYSKERYFIDENKFKEMEGFAVKENDLIISCSGTMGRISIIPKNHKQGIINQALLKLTPNKVLVNPHFLKYYLQSSTIQNRFFTNQSGAVIQNVASVKVLKKIPFPKVDIELQNKIVEKIKDELKVIKLNKNLVDTYKTKIQKTISIVFSN